ncbi:MAG: methionine--tRNA ligase subunit beta [Nanoarchaeota archaeon]|nr:methionine--tRNA ligase subunit beta [Nanoarchaeota archaeon]
MDEIDITDFRKASLRVGKIIDAQEIEGSEKLLKLIVDLKSSKRQVIAGIKQFYKPSDLIGKKVIVVFNLKPKNIMGYESQGMILAASNEGQISLLTPDKDIEEGSEIF